MHLFYVCHVLLLLTVGSLVMRHPGEMSTPTQGSILFGTVNGAIGKSVVTFTHAFCKQNFASSLVVSGMTIHSGFVQLSSTSLQTLR